MHTTHTRIASRSKRGFTLVELLTAMAITAILVVLIMQLTNQSVSLWKTMREDSSTASTARVALQTICRDLESTQIRSGTNDYQWLSAQVDDPIKGMPKGLKIPRSSRLLFFTCTPDHNPPISAESSARSSYSSTLASNPATQGDVGTVSYRLLFRDQVLNLPNKNGDNTMFPLFSLYRNVISPRDTFEKMLGQSSLTSAYSSFEKEEERNFLCENIVEMSLLFHVEYADEGSSERARTKSITIPILATSARKDQQRFSIFSSHASTTGENLPNARIHSIEIALTILTEEGVSIIEQVRLGQRRPPALEDFYSRYTRSFSRTVTLPIPL